MGLIKFLSERVAHELLTRMRDLEDRQEHVEDVVDDRLDKIVHQSRRFIKRERDASKAASADEGGYPGTTNPRIMALRARRAAKAARKEQLREMARGAQTGTDNV